VRETVEREADETTFAGLNGKPVKTAFFCLLAWALSEEHSHVCSLDMIT
jgi:hypothetical protein